MGSYPQPLSPKPFDTSVFPVRQFSPLPYPSPTPSPPPALPSLPRSPAFCERFGFVSSTHLLPATRPRTYPHVPRPVLPHGFAVLGKTARAEALKRVVDVIFQRQTELPKGELGPPSEEVLWNCVNRYSRRRPGRDGVTLFFVHANGFPKEIWEPFIGLLLETPAGRLIEEIWSWEAVQHGDAALINEDNLSGIFDWASNGRDIQNFLTHYLPPATDVGILPTILQAVPESESQARLQRGFIARKLVVIGHSYGGTSSTLAASLAPKLFSSLILVDPIISRPEPNDASFDMSKLRNFVGGALSRREHWSSKEEAYELFSKNPFFAVWRPAVLANYVEHGLSPDPFGAGGVRLKQRGLWEALVFAERRLPSEAWVLLESLDERVTLRWMMPDPNLQRSGSAPVFDVAAERVWRRMKNTSNAIVPNAGHLIPQENPEFLARDLGEYLRSLYGTPKAQL